jgi:phosphoribosylaminoimidazole-succinocarboxamide synthase
LHAKFSTGDGFLRKISEGKTKTIYETQDKDVVLIKFNDDITALDGEKHDILPGKGEINAAISAELFQELQRGDIPTHFISLEPSGDMMRAKRLEMIPVEVVCRNLAAGHFLSRFPMFKRGERLPIPVIEFYLKNDQLHDPMLVEDHLPALGLASREETEKMKEITRKANKILLELFLKRGLTLVDFKLEFGRDLKREIVLGDELNCDSMRLWEIDTGEALDKDVYRKGGSLEDVRKIYEKGLRRIVGEKSHSSSP